MIDENLDGFLADFGLDVEFGELTAKGILNKPDQIVGEIAQTTVYDLTIKASSFTGLAQDSAVTVDGEGYTVNEIFKIDDGKFLRVILSKDEES